jgi:hypothetical protein
MDFPSHPRGWFSIVGYLLVEVAGMTIKDIACGVNHNPPWQLSANWHGLPFPQLPIRAFSPQSKSHRQTGPTGLSSGDARN